VFESLAGRPAYRAAQRAIVGHRGELAGEVSRVAGLAEETGHAVGDREGQTARRSSAAQKGCSKTNSIGSTLLPYPK
jgi:hypothetical protein